MADVNLQLVFDDVVACSATYLRLLGCRRPRSGAKYHFGSTCSRNWLFEGSRIKIVPVSKAVATKTVATKEPKSGPTRTARCGNELYDEADHGLEYGSRQADQAYNILVDGALNGSCNQDENDFNSGADDAILNPLHHGARYRHENHFGSGADDTVVDSTYNGA